MPSCSLGTACAQLRRRAHSCGRSVHGAPAALGHPPVPPPTGGRTHSQGQAHHRAARGRVVVNVQKGPPLCGVPQGAGGADLAGRHAPRAAHRRVVGRKREACRAEHEAGAAPPASGQAGVGGPQGGRQPGGKHIRCARCLHGLQRGGMLAPGAGRRAPRSSALACKSGIGLPHACRPGRRRHSSGACCMCGRCRQCSRRRCARWESHWQPAGLPRR